MSLDAIRGEKTLAELATQYDVHPNPITDWKTQLLERASGVFGAAPSAEPKTDLKELHAKIGPQALEVERANQVWAMDITYVPMARG